ncbi:MAG: hypothetical protein CMJ73_03915 [Planctomycetaceae bacterium]|nr:hypothetical protein [Planctomycetaceae bacterium]
MAERDLVKTTEPGTLIIGDRQLLWVLATLARGRYIRADDGGQQFGKAYPVSLCKEQEHVT